jgi:hypothetical protein
LICCPSAYSSILTQFYSPYLAHILGFGSLVESKWCHYVMLRLTATSNCFPHPYYTYTKCLSTLPLICCPSAYHQQPYTDTHPTWLRCWGSGSLVGQNDVIMSRLTLTATPQTASHIQIRHIQSVWAHWYAVHQHTTAALLSFTHPTWLRLWGYGSLMESKWCHYVKVEADSHFKLLPTSILHIESV